MINTVVLDGKIEGNPELRKLEKSSVVNFVIVNEMVSARKTQENHVKCEAWGPAGKAVMAYRDGDSVTITGALHENSWTKDDGTVVSSLRLRVNGIAGRVTVLEDSPQNTPAPAPVAAGVTNEVPF